MIAVATFSSSIRLRSVSRLVRSLVLTRNWVIFLLVLAGRATSIVLGFDRNLSASFLIGGGIVAENSKVCRFAGNLVQIFSMSGMNPMSSIRSASSLTRRLQQIGRASCRERGGQ